MTLNELLQIIGEIKEYFESNNLKSSLEKLEKFLAKNKNLKIFANDLNPLISSSPLNTVAVEWSFSEYNSFLTDKRTNFTENNIEKYMIASYNRFLSNI